MIINAMKEIGLFNNDPQRDKVTFDANWLEIINIILKKDTVEGKKYYPTIFLNLSLKKELKDISIKVLNKAFSSKFYAKYSETDMISKGE